MKKAVSVIIAVLLAAASPAFAFGEGELHLQLELDGGWQKQGTGYSEGSGVIYLHQSGAMLLQLQMTAEMIIGQDICQQFYHTSLWPTVLELTLNNLLERFGCKGDPYEVPMNDGIGCFAADTEFQGSAAVFAVVQYDSDLWVLICTEGNGASARSLFEKVCGSVRTAESPADGAYGGGKDSPEYAEGYYIPEVPFILHLDDKDLNIYTQDTPADGLTMRRTAKDKATMDWYVGATGSKIIVTYPDSLPSDVKIEIRVKDEKYRQWPSWDTLGEEALDSAMKTIYGDQVSSYTVYKTDTATFAVFKMSIDVDAIRYVTIKNGDIVYVHLKRGDGPLTESDLALIRRVADAMEFIDQ